MATENGKQPAFPTTSEGAAFGSQGMSKREKIAAMAMQGLLATATAENLYMIGDMSVEIADALLKALAESEASNG